LLKRDSTERERERERDRERKRALLYLSLAVFILHWGLGGRSHAAMCFAIALDKSV
jgi:hypothetical protein